MQSHSWQLLKQGEEGLFSHMLWMGDRGSERRSDLLKKSFNVMSLKVYSRGDSKMVTRRRKQKACFLK
jgi:hypothetical protein